MKTVVALALALSLCACQGSHTSPDGVPAQQGIQATDTEDQQPRPPDVILCDTLWCGCYVRPLFGGGQMPFPGVCR